jgi:hypothetical protein
MTVVSLPARGRPPEAAARRAGLEFVEKLLTSAMVALLGHALVCWCHQSLTGHLGGFTFAGG